MRSASLVCPALLAAATLTFNLFEPNNTFGQPQPKAAPAAEAVEMDPAKAVAEFIKRRDDLAKLDQKLRKEFETATPERKQKIAAEHTAAMNAFGRYAEKIIPIAAKAAIPAYIKDEKDVGAEDLTLAYLGSLLQTNRYADTAKVADELIAAGRSNPALYTFSGMAHFAIHDFAKAKELLTEAGKRDLEGQPQEATVFLKSCDQYAKYWETEKAIRAKEAKANDLPIVVFKTSRGDITLELFENEAPNTVANFISLVESKYYDGTKFHRVIPNFMAQGGDAKSKDDDPSDDGTGGPGYRIPCECYEPNARIHFQGSLSMAHAGKDTGGSQFFLTHLPTAHLNPNAQAERGHTVFGRITKGMNIAAALQVGDEILSAKVVRKRDHEYKPKTTAGD